MESYLGLDQPADHRRRVVRDRAEPGAQLPATSRALTQSRRAGLWLSAGIALGTTIWSTASLLGLGLLFQTAGWLYLTVKFVGAGYLVFLGLRALLAARHAAPISSAARATAR